MVIVCCLVNGRTGLAALDMISKISLERNEIHMVPLVRPPPPDLLPTTSPYSPLTYPTSCPSLPPQIFLDTLYHFSETIQLATTASDTYLAPLNTYTPLNAPDVKTFESLYGAHLWETDEASYDYLVKVEPAQRAYEELGVKGVVTGRRRSQGEEREGLKVVEVDERGLVKVNPLMSWTFKQVRDYIDKE